MKPDQERVRNLLTDTVTLLCKNGLQFTKELKVQGLLGITTDDNDVFVVHINECFGEAVDSTANDADVETSSRVDIIDNRNSGSSRLPGRKTKRFSQDEDDLQKPVKTMKKSDNNSQGQHMILPPEEIKTEDGRLPCAGAIDDRNAMLSSYGAEAGTHISGEASPYHKRQIRTSHGVRTPSQSDDSPTINLVDDSALSELESMVMDPVAGSSTWDPLQCHFPPGVQPDHADQELQTWQRENVTRSAFCRRRMKEKDPKKYAEYLQKQKATAKEKRDRLKRELQKENPASWAKSEQKKLREQGRERQRRSRSRSSLHLPL